MKVYKISYLILVITILSIITACTNSPETSPSEVTSSQDTFEERIYSLSWDEDVQITATGAPSFYPTLGLNEEKIHLAWVDWRYGDENSEIYYIQSSDSGLTWQSSDTRISNSPLLSIKADFAVNDDTVHLFWRDNRHSNFEEYYIRSIDGGLSWQTEKRITNADGLSGCPFPAINGNEINLFFRDDRSGTFKIYQKRSADGGNTWCEDILLTPDAVIAEFPFPAISGDDIYLVWRDNRDGNAEIYYKTSTDGGVNWSADKRLTNNPAESEHPKIVVQNNILHVTWRDNRDGTCEIYYKQSKDKGKTWSSDTRLTRGYGQSYWPMLATSNDILHLMWCREQDESQYLYYMCSSDDGVTWSAETKLSNCVIPFDAGIMGAHPILATRNYIHIVFNDNRTGANEIYYKRGTILK